MQYIIKNSAGIVKKPVVLIAPLDWGLGHATRCIPMINTLISIDYEVIIACEGPQAALLMQEFPTLKCVFLPGYRLKYARSGWKTIIRILTQLPKILISIKQEHQWLTSFLLQNEVNAVISDNRYGLFHQNVPSVIITHQLNIKSLWRRMGEGFLRKLHYGLINKFTECWVPDYPGQINLAGDLSHPAKLPAVPVKYIGPLTRMKLAKLHVTQKLLIILSGPEPQRTILENRLLHELKDFKEPVVMIRGLPGNNTCLKGFNKARFINHLPSAEMNNLVNSSEIVLSRPGYSTVMDMMALQKKCIFIPTPGQTEQIYLAKHLRAGKHCLFYSQRNFSLLKALNEMKSAKLLPFNAHPQNELESFFKDLLR